MMSRESSPQNNLKDINEFYNKIKSFIINQNNRYKEYNTFAFGNRHKNYRHLSIKAMLIKKLIYYYCFLKYTNEMCAYDINPAWNQDGKDIQENLSIISEEEIEDDQIKLEEEELDSINANVSYLLSSLDISTADIKEEKEKNFKGKTCNNKIISGFKLQSSEKSKEQVKDENELISEFKLTDTDNDICSLCKKTNNSAKRRQNSATGQKQIQDKSIKNKTTEKSENTAKIKQSKDKIYKTKRNLCIKIENNFCKKYIESKYNSKTVFNTKICNKKTKIAPRDKMNKNKNKNNNIKTMNILPVNNNSIESNKENMNSVNNNGKGNEIFSSKNKLNSMNTHSSSVKYNKLNNNKNMSLNNRPLINIINKESLSQERNSNNTYLNIQSKKVKNKNYNKKFILIKRKKLYNRLMHKIDLNENVSNNNLSNSKNFRTNDSKDTLDFGLNSISIKNRINGCNSISPKVRSKNNTNIILSTRKGNKSVDLRKNM